VRVIDLRLHEGNDLAPIRPLPEVRDDRSHLTALMRLESTGDSLARVVTGRGETVGIVTLERLREPLF
jgi:CBS domain containing-hemolysin-like protein